MLLGDVLSSAYQQAQVKQGVFNPDTVSVGDLFIGALLPGLLLVGLYIAYLLIAGMVPPRTACLPMWRRRRPRLRDGLLRVLKALLPALALIMAVLGSIIFGLATPTEAAGVGALGGLAAGRRCAAS